MVGATDNLSGLYVATSQYLSVCLIYKYNRYLWWVNGVLGREAAAKKEKTIAKGKAYSEVSARGKKNNQGKVSLEKVLRVI